MTMNKTKRALVVAFVFCEMTAILTAPFQVHALFGGKPKVPSPSAGIRDFLEDDLNVSVDELSNVTEVVNFAEQKGEYPRVTIQFSNPHPKEGELVTATAVTNSLKDPTVSYFTWYIRNENDDNNSNLAALEQYKVNAVRKHVKTYFDWLRFDEPYNANGTSPNGDGIVQFEEFQHTDGDNDAFFAHIGGESAIEKNDYCYVYDRESGDQYEMVESAEQGGYSCPDGKRPTCLFDSRETLCPLVILPLEGQASGGNATGGSATGGSATGGSTGSSGGSAAGGAAAGGSAEGGAAEGGNVSLFSPEGPREAPYNICSEAGLGTCTDAGVICQNPAATPYCIPDNPPAIATDLDQCPTPVDWFTLLEVSGGVYFHPEFPTCETVAGAAGWPVAECIYIGDLAFEGVNSCDSNDIHLFPDMVPGSTGNDTFGAEEEYFWQTDGTNVATTPYGPDERFVAGLGVSTYQWVYSEGDELGVVVEGLSSTAAKHDNSSEQIVFLFVKGCELEYPTGSYFASIGGGKDAEILTIAMGEDELNLCILEGDNFVKPGENERTDLEVDILGTDNNDIVQNSIGNVLSLEGSISNRNDATDAKQRQTSYRWSFACSADKEALLDTSDESRNNGGLNITQNIVDQVRSEPSRGLRFPTENLHQIGEQIGIEGSGLSTMEIPVDLPGGCFAGDETFMRVRLIVNEPGDRSNETNYGRKDKIFRVSNDPQFLEVYKVSVNTGGASGLPEVTRAEQVCAQQGLLTDLDHAFCRVVSGELMGFYVPELSFPQNVQWTVNGEAVYCNGSPQCDQNPGQSDAIQDSVFIPILGNTNDEILVTATINDPTEPGEVVSISRILRIVEPQIRIIPGGGGTDWKPLGEYVDLEGAAFGNFSDRVMTFSGTVSLQVETVPPFIEDDISEFLWSTGGEDNVATPTGAYSFVPIVVDDVYTTAHVRVVAQLETPQEDRLFMREQYGIGQFNTSSRQLEGEITVTDAPVAAVGSAGNSTFFGSVLTNTPQYMLFLLKLVLVMGVLLFSSSLIIGIGARRS